MTFVEGDNYASSSKLSNEAKDAFSEININPDREAAELEAATLRDSPGIVVYSDASGHHGQLGAAAVALKDNLEVAVRRKICVGPMEHWSVYAAELIGIFYAISLILKLAHKSQRNQKSATILSDSMSALQAIKNPSNQSAQRIIHAILQVARELAARGIPIRLQWIPGHCDDPSNDAADRSAKEAVGLRKTHPICHLLSRERCKIRHQTHQKWKHEWITSKVDTDVILIQPLSLCFEAAGQGDRQEGNHGAKATTGLDEAQSLSSSDIRILPIEGPATTTLGLSILKPAAYAIWERIRASLNDKLKRIGVQNCAFPLSSVENTGVSGDNRYDDNRYARRDTEPRLRDQTSTTSMICSYYARWIASPHDFPLRLNQWTTAFRSEPWPQHFLRCREFLIQEAHTVHKTQYDAHSEMLQVLDLYTALYEKLLAVPLLKGQQGNANNLDETQTAVLFGLIPTLQQCIQAGVCHELGQHMSKEYSITISEYPGDLQNNASSTLHVWQNSWSFSIRAIGLMIATHGDDRGLVLPPYIAETQVVIIPYQDTHNPHDHQRLYAEIFSIQSTLTSLDIRVTADLRNWCSTGWKVQEWVTRGAPLRLVVGSEELAGRYVTIYRRDLPKSEERTTMSLSQLPTGISELLKTMHKGLFEKAQNTLRSRQRQVTDWNEFVEILCNRKTACICLVPHCLTKDCQQRIESSRSELAAENDTDFEVKPVAASVKFLCMPWDQPSDVHVGDVSKCINPECIHKANKWAMFGFKCE
ncbi:uncharacterized protein KD926_001867 [Aspergillus affinis]|uniref:uncharacterized protein n=1 Tax=Aspergillus affinis TaxID=1070780 RepID=UPI0022FEDB49|nr:uncharacterized protein KD926_001867 [Aspergillus affinis]KAI9044045.1 hypothetical protein KD926_001867 [Aspergillus affinis]